MMPNLPMGQLAAGVFVVVTPWIVARIALAVASRHARAMGAPIATPRALGVLLRATAIALLTVGSFAVALPPRSPWMALVDGVAFVTLAIVALRVLHDLDAASRAARYVDSPTRVASLVARRQHEWLPWSWRVVLYGLTMTGLALFVWRATIPSDGRRMFVTVGFALIATVFLCLYQAWIHSLVTGPLVEDASGDETRRRSIRTVFAAEVILVSGFLALAHALLNVDWAQASGWALTGALSGAFLGVIGCGYALASDLSTRRYARVDAETRG